MPHERRQAFRFITPPPRSLGQKELMLGKELGKPSPGNPSSGHSAACTARDFAADYASCFRGKKVLFARLVKNGLLLRFPHPSPFNVPISTPHG
jgi:hypothetical protein